MLNFRWGYSVTEEDPMSRHRLNVCKTFIRIPIPPVLDVGDRNFVGVNLNPLADNTLSCDFNKEILAPREKYETVFCFEVLEHVKNPGLFCDNLRKLVGGKLYLSTPLAGLSKPGPHHFAEYRWETLETLLVEAGFKINRVKIFRTVPFRYIFRCMIGIRPFIRAIFWFACVKTVLVECE